MNNLHPSDENLITDSTGELVWLDGNGQTHACVVSFGSWFILQCKLLVNGGNQPELN